MTYLCVVEMGKQGIAKYGDSIVLSIMSRIETMLLNITHDKRRKVCQMIKCQMSDLPETHVHLTSTAHTYHDDVIKWKYFPCYWPFVREIHRHRWISSRKACDTELWCFLGSAPE